MTEAAKNLTRRYLITAKKTGAQRLIKTTHAARALSHVAADEYEVKTPTPDELVDLTEAGVKTEVLA